MRRLAAAFSTKIGLACRGGDAPQAEVGRAAHDVLAQGALEVAVRAHGLDVADPVLVVAHQQRGLLGFERLLGHARERLPGLLHATRHVTPPGGAGGSRWRRAGAAPRSALIRACSIAGAMCAAAAATSRTVLGGEAVWLGIVDEQHADRARRAADRDRDQRLDPEGVGPPAGDERRHRRAGDDRLARVQRRLGGRQHRGSAAHQLPFGEIARAVRIPRGRGLQPAVLDQKHCCPACAGHCRHALAERRAASRPGRRRRGRPR